MENLETWFGQAPLWQLGIVIFGIMILCAVLGYGARWLKRRAKATDEEEDERDSQEGYLVSAMMGLFALLLGFTFAMAVDRFDFRRGKVLEEANAIGTTYLRAQILETPHRERISRLLVAYTDNRIALGKAAKPQPEMLALNDQLITKLWQATLAAFPTIRGYDFSSAFLDSMNTVIDLDAARKAGRMAHVPNTVFIVLGIYAAGTAAVLGGVLISGRSRIPAFSVMALFVLAFMLIIDIDRPTMGTISESQAPMEWLRASTLSQSPEVFDQVPD